jgi:hypothetical protein
VINFLLAGAAICVCLSILARLEIICVAMPAEMDGTTAVSLSRKRPRVMPICSCKLPPIAPVPKTTHRKPERSNISAATDQCLL